jgi:CRP/FNR family cyclic AMP-dependent transcriptional regulator
MPVDRAFLSSLSFLSEQPAATLEAVAAIGVRLSRPAGSVLFLAGEEAPGLFIVIAGRVKIVRESPAGREQVLAVIEPGNHFNLVPIFDGGPTPATAICLSAVELLLLPAVALRELTRRTPDLAMALLADAGSFLRRLVGLVDDLALHTVQGRVARLLLTQAEAADRGEPVAPLTQAEMAARLGTVREMVGRTLKTFEALGLISVARGAIAIVDREGLAVQADA